MCCGSFYGRRSSCGALTWFYAFESDVSDNNVLSCCFFLVPIQQCNCNISIFPVFTTTQCCGANGKKCCVASPPKWLIISEYCLTCYVWIIRALNDFRRIFIFHFPPLWKIKVRAVTSEWQKIERDNRNFLLSIRFNLWKFSEFIPWQPLMFFINYEFIAARISRSVLHPVSPVLSTKEA